MVKKSRNIALICALFTLLFAYSTLAQEIALHEVQTEFSEDIVGKIKKYKTFYVNVDTLIRDLEERGATQLNIQYDGKQYELDIERNHNLRIGQQYQRKLDRAGRTIIPARGKTEIGKKVSITFANDFIYGTIQLGHEHSLFIQPLRFFKKDAENNEFILFYSDDVLGTKDGICGTTHEHDLRKRVEGQAESMQQTGDCLEVEIAIASDFSMFQKYGSVVDVEDRNIGVMNDVQTNYDDEFADELNYVIVDQFVSDCASCDPWTSSTDAGSLLNDFSNWGPSGFAEPHDVGSLWSDRNFNGSTIGLAWVGTVCRNRRYHILQDFSSNAEFLRVLTAHELGHNFDAIHDASGAPFIMAPSVSMNTDWSSQSISDMESYINGVSCLTQCAGLIEANFAFNSDNICEDNDVHFYDASIGNIVAWDWSFPGGSPSSSSDQYPVVNYSTPGVYDVTLEVENSDGLTDVITIPAAITVGSGGEGIPLYQDFEDGLGNWSTQNTGLGWQVVSTLGNSMGENAIHVNNTANPFNAVETLSSPIFSLLGYQTATLHLDYAYARRNSQSDSLAIDISTDGGATYTNVASFFETGSGTFSTAPNQQGFFEPETSDDWCDGAFASCIQVPLNSFVGNHEVQIRIRNRSLGGNVIYINRVWVSTDCYNLFPPIADFDADVTIGCASLNVNFEDLSSSDPIEWFWEFEGGVPETSTERFPTVLYTTEGVYEVSLTVSNPEGSNTETKSAFIVVDDVPQADFSYTINGAEVSFTNETINGNTYAWDFGDGVQSAEENPVHDYIFNGTYNVELVATNNCGDHTASQSIQLQAAPTAQISSDVTSGCNPLTVNYDASDSYNADSFTWTFEGGSPSTSNAEMPQVTYDSAGVFDVTLIVVNTFGTDTLNLTDYMVVEETPESDFSYMKNELEVNFTSEAFGTDSLFWDFGDGNNSTQANPTHLYAAPGTYDVALIAFSNNCGNDTLTQSIEVDENISAAYQPSQTEGCAPLEVQYTLSSMGATSVNWTFEGGTPASSSDNNPVVIYNTPGVYDVQLIVSDGSTSDTLVNQDQIVVLGPPSPSFSSEIDQRTVEFTNTSINATAYLWDFGDGNSSTNPNPTHTYGADGIYMVTLMAINECDTINVDEAIEIATPPVADFSFNVSSGCIPLEVIFTNESSENANSFTWIFEGGTPAGSNDESPQITYNQAGIYDVTLIVASNGGRDTLVIQDAIEVFPDPVADFNVSVDSLEVAFSNTSTDATEYSWDFGDGNSSTEQNPVHIYAQGGSYTVTLTAINDCDTATYSREIGTGGLPQADFQISGATEGCIPFEVSFEDISDGNVTSWEWTFEGATPSTSTEQNPTVVYNQPGIYDVMLRVTNSVGDNEVTRQDVVIVHEPAEGDFSYTIDSSFYVSFDGMLLTDPNANILWDFGDGTTSNIEDVQHTYPDEGNYNVLFIVSNFCNSDTTSEEIVIIRGSSFQNELNNVILYPNPARDFFQLRGFEGAVDIHIVDLNGKEVFTQKNLFSQQKVYTRDWPGGIYQVYIKQNNQVGNFKVVIQP